MSLLNNNFMTFGGESVTGRVPTQMIVYAPEGYQLSKMQQGAVSHAYKLFCDAVRVSVAGYHVQNRILPDGTKVRMESMQGRDRVFVWAGAPSDGEEQAMPKGWRALPSSDGGVTGWVRHKTTGALWAVAGVDDAITRPGYEGTNPHVFIAAGNGDVKLNSKHAAGDWYWTDHKKQRLLFAKNGAYYRQKLVSFHVGGAKVEGVVRGGGIAGGWILLVVADKLYALKKSAVELSTSSKPVAAIVVGTVPVWEIPNGLRPIWRFSPNGLKAVAVEGLGRVNNPANKHLSSTGPTTGAQFIHRLELAATNSSAMPFDLSVREEVRQNSVLKIQPRYQFTTNELELEKFEFLRWGATAYAVITYALHFEFSPKTYHWTRQNLDTYLTQQEYDELADAVGKVRADPPDLTGSRPATSLILHPHPGMRDYVLEPDPTDPYRFSVSYTAADGSTAYVSGSVYAGYPGTPTYPTFYALVTVRVRYGGWPAGWGDDKILVGRDDGGVSVMPIPSTMAGHVDFVNSGESPAGDDAYYDLRALSPGCIGRFSDTYPLATTPRPLNDVVQEAKDLVASFAGQTVPSELVLQDAANAKIDEEVQSLRSPTTLDEALDMEARPEAYQLRQGARPSSVFRYTDGGMSNLGVYPSGPMSVNDTNPDRLLADSTFWQRYYTEVQIYIRPKPVFNLYYVYDYTAATTWAYAGRCIVDIDYDKDGSERVLELVADESKAVRYDVSLRAVEVHSGDITPEAQAQRSLSGSCRFTLQLDGNVVADSTLSATDSFSGFLWTERREDWKDFPSNTWANLRGEGNIYDMYLGKPRNADGTGQIANTECAGSMACQVSSSGFELLDWDVRFGHVLLADTTQQATRTTKATAIDAERTTGTIGVSLWDDGKKRVLHPPVQAPESHAMWYGAVPMLQRMLYRGASLTRPAVYLTGKTPQAYSFGINGSTPPSVSAHYFALNVGQALATDRPALDVFYEYFQTGLVFLDYEAVLAPPRARAFSEAGNAYTLGYVLSYSPKVWLAVVNRDRMSPYNLVLPSFSVVRAETFEQPSTAKRLGELLPYLQNVASAGAMALPRYVV